MSVQLLKVEVCMFESMLRKTLLKDSEGWEDNKSIMGIMGIIIFAKFMLAAMNV